MDLQSRSINSWDNQIVSSILEVKSLLGLTARDLQKILKVSPVEFNAVVNKQTSIGLDSLFELSEFLELDLKSLINADYDKKSLYKHFHEDTTYLSEKYTMSATSNLRNAVSMLNFVKKKYGSDIMIEIMRKFQLTPELLNNPDLKVNMVLGTDIVEYLYKTFIDISAIEDMGKFASLSNSNTPFSEPMKNLRSSREAMEFMIEEVVKKYIEENFIWSLASINNNGCILEGSPNKDVCDEIGNLYHLSSVASYYRRGFAATIPVHSNFPMTSVTTTSCISQGDACTRYEISFTNKTKQPSSQASYLH